MVEGCGEVGPSSRSSSPTGRAADVGAAHRNSSGKGRLRWRARRGTRELDTMLCWWIDQRLDGADAATLSAFDALLDCQDPDLWDWLMGHAACPRPDWQAIIDDIRAAHRL